MRISIQLDDFTYSLLAVISASILAWTVRVVARRDSHYSGVFQYEDGSLWQDWIVAAFVAFATFALQNVAPESGLGNGLLAAGAARTASAATSQTLALPQVASLLAVAILSLAVIPTYVRFFGYDASNRLTVWRGMVLPNVMATAVLVTTIRAGVSML
jgi:hypothetical protein